MTGGSPFGFSASFSGSASFFASLPVGGLSAFFLAAASSSTQHSFHETLRLFCLVLYYVTDT